MAEPTPSTEPALPAPPDRRALIGIGLTLLAMFLLGLQDALTKMVAEMVSIPQIILVRYWAFAIFAAVLLGRRRGALTAALRSRTPWLQVVRALICVLEVSVFATALTMMPMSEATVLVNIAPLLATAMAALLLREKVGLGSWLAVGLGFVGVLLIMRPGFALFDPAALVPLAAAFLFALYMVLNRKCAVIDGFSSVFLYTAWVGCAAATLIAPFTWVTPPVESLVPLALLTISGIAVHMLIMKSLDLAPANLLQPFNYTQIIFGVGIGMLAFGERPDLYTYIGAGIIGSAGLIATIKRKNKTSG